MRKMEKRATYILCFSGHVPYGYLSVAFSGIHCLFSSCFSESPTSPFCYISILIFSLLYCLHIRTFGRVKYDYCFFEFL